jgi:hypothetical protein
MSDHEREEFARRVKTLSALERDGVATVALLTSFLFLFIASGSGLRWLGAVPVLGGFVFVVNAVLALFEGRRVDADADNPYLNRRGMGPLRGIFFGAIMMALGLGAMRIF